MRRALRRAAQVFVAAGALGLVGPALAQSSRPAGKSVPVPVSQTVPSAHAEVPAGEAALDEMQVELGWLANKSTFHHTLGAYVVGGMLEVRGYVPTLAIKDQAVRVAQQHTTLPVVDRLQINASVVIPIGGGAAEELTQKANEVLADGLGDQASGLTVTAHDNGVVTVKGAVLSMEDKLAVSRKMRQVSGCSAVVNQISVTPVLRAGHLVTQLSADGSQVLDNGPNPAAPRPPLVQPQTPPVTPAPVKPPITAPVVVVTPAPILPPPAAVVVTPAPVKPPVTEPAVVVTPAAVKPPVVSTPKAVVAAPAPVGPVGPWPASSSDAVSAVPPMAIKIVAKPTPLIVQQAPAPTTAKPTAGQYTSGAVATVPLATPVISKPPTESVVVAKTPALPEKKPTPAALMKSPAPVEVVKTPTPPDIKPTASAPLTNSAWSDKPATVKKPATVAAPVEAPKLLTMASPKVEAMPRTTESEKPATPITPVAAQAPTTAAKPAPVVETPAHGDKWPAAYEEKPAHVAYATSGMVVFDDDLTPPPQIKAAPAPTVKTVSASTSAIPMAVVKPTITPQPEIVTTTGGDPFAPLPNSAASKLKHDIETVCGKQARDVQVVVQADKMMHVTVKVNDVKVQLALTDKILQLPEMATPNVRLEMQVTDKK